jgi:transcription antitermination factor NusG
MQPEWNALYVRHNHEKATSRFLAAHGVDHYLPLYSEQSEWSNRQKRVVERPVFPGYLFVRFAPEQRRRVLMAPGVVCLTNESEVGAITGTEIA